MEVITKGFVCLCLVFLCSLGLPEGILGEENKSKCPPETFTSQEGFNLTAWAQHPFYIQEQMVTVFQPRENLFCTRALYTMINDERRDELEVLLTENEGGVNGKRNEPGSMGFSHKMIVPDLSIPSQVRDM